MCCRSARPRTAPWAPKPSIFFNPQDARDFEYRRKKSGHLMSKMRFVSAQLEAYLEDGHWLKCAAAPTRWRSGWPRVWRRLGGIEIAHPVSRPTPCSRAAATRRGAELRDAGAKFYDWGRRRTGAR